MTRRADTDVTIARRILAADAAPDRRDAALGVHEKLAARLIPLIGSSGMRALVARSAKLVTPEFPCFAVVSGPADGVEAGESVLEQLQTSFARLEGGAVDEAAVALYATLLAILTSLIGEALTLQVLQTSFSTIEQVAKETER